MVSTLWAVLRLAILLNFFADKIAKLILWIYRILLKLYVKFIYRPLYLKYRKEEFEKRKAELIKEYKQQEALEKKEEFNHFVNHLRDQKVYNHWDKELHSIPFEMKYGWLDYLKDYDSEDEVTTSSQIAIRHWLNKLFWL